LVEEVIYDEWNQRIIASNGASERAESDYTTERSVDGKLEWYSELLRSEWKNKHTILVVVRIVQATA
jgi:hypothetical protein